jgi:hypothetical protein
VNEVKQRQIFLDMIDRIDIKKMPVQEAIRIAAQEEQALLDEFFRR